MPTMVTDIFNGFFSSIDNVLYRLIEILISIFDYIANVTLFSDGVLEKFYDRVFYFVSIVMIFKVSFSIIQYILNPEQFSNGERGFGKVIQGILLALVGLVVVKPIFIFAKDIQNKVLDQNVIPSLILGINGGSEEEENVSTRIPFYLAQAFVFPKEEFVEKREKNKIILKSGVSKFEVYASNGVPISLNRGYEIATDEDNPNTSMLLSLVNAKNNVDGGNDEKYIFEYRPLVSTACAIFVVIMYLNFCIDLAIRVVKLGFLQIVAPIPIISMVDPKSTKNGMMSKWLKNCFSTYAGLFIRIAAVSFVIFGIKTLMNELNDNLNSEVGLYKNIVIIFGLLMFAKDLPKLISDITGVDLKGDFKINPLKRVSENPAIKPITTVGSAALGGAIGAAGGLAANAVALRNNFGSMSGRERFSSFLGLGTGALSAGFRGAFSKEKNILKKASTGIQGSVAARNLRDARVSEGIGGLGGAINRTISGVHNWAGVEEGATAYDKELSALSEAESQANDILTRANSEMIKYNDLIALVEARDDDGNLIKDANGNVKKGYMNMQNFKQTKERLNVLRNMDANSFKDDVKVEKDKNGKVVKATITKSRDEKLREHVARINNLQNWVAKNEKAFEQSYVSTVMNQTDAKGNPFHIDDSITTYKMQGLQHYVEKSPYAEISDNHVTTGEEIKKFKDNMLAEQAKIKNSDAYKQALVNKKDSAAAKK